jgi:hypothetical protein
VDIPTLIITKLSMATPDGGLTNVAYRKRRALLFLDPATLYLASLLKKHAGPPAVPPRPGACVCARLPHSKHP